MSNGLGQKFFGPGNPPVVFTGAAKILNEQGRPMPGVGVELTSSDGDIYAIGSSGKDGVVRFVNVPVYGYKMTSFRVAGVDETALPGDMTVIRLWTRGMGVVEAAGILPLTIGLGTLAFLALLAYNSSTGFKKR